MSTPLLTTKLYIPPVRPELLSRPHLIGRLNAGLHRKLTLISAPAGFGKTALLSEWVGSCGRPVAWVSLDEGDNDLARFLAYFIAALQKIEENIGGGVWRSIAVWNLGIVYWTGGDTVAGSQALEEAARISREMGNVMVAVAALCRLAGLCIVQGRLDQAQVIREQALALASDEQGRPLPVAGEALIGLAE